MLFFGAPKAPKIRSVALPPMSPASTPSPSHPAHWSSSATTAPRPPLRSGTPHPSRPYRPTSIPAPTTRTTIPTSPPTPPLQSTLGRRGSKKGPPAHRVMAPIKGILKRRNDDPNSSRAERRAGDGPEVVQSPPKSRGYDPASFAVMGIGQTRKGEPSVRPSDDEGVEVDQIFSSAPLKDSVISLNWILVNQDAEKKRPREFLHLQKGFDMAHHPMQQGLSLYDTYRRCHVDPSYFLEQPVSSHCTLDKMRIVFTPNPDWYWMLSRAEGLRCIDVLEGIYKMLQVPLTEAEMVAHGLNRYSTARRRADILGASPPFPRIEAAR
ncbi:hypothetical protein AAF712_002678 [Marasmius tenuissimus]|uniref:DUF6699 domain-containing protein n=1 Tax=Marasmius tenuissimus TaxID=585030 RepID=A0ABR3AB07_9AGAR